MTHNNEYCPKYKDKVLPNEKGNCSLCDEKLTDITTTPKLFSLTVKEDFENAGAEHVIAKDPKEAEEKMIKIIMEAKEYTKEDVEDTYTISDIHELTEIEGYKITLTKIQLFCHWLGAIPTRCKGTTLEIGGEKFYENIYCNIQNI